VPIAIEQLYGQTISERNVFSDFNHGLLVLLGHKIARPIRCQKLGVS
jgi:hypothetical protein